MMWNCDQGPLMSISSFSSRRFFFGEDGTTQGKPELDGATYCSNVLSTICVSLHCFVRFSASELSNSPLLNAGLSGEAASIYTLTYGPSVQTIFATAQKLTDGVSIECRQRIDHNNGNDHKIGHRAAHDFPHAPFTLTCHIDHL